MTWPTSASAASLERSGVPSLGQNFRLSSNSFPQTLQDFVALMSSGFVAHPNDTEGRRRKGIGRGGLSKPRRTCILGFPKPERPMNPMIKRRDMLVQVLLFIVTCGIYSIYWFYQTTVEMKELAKDSDVSPGLWAVLLILP